MYEVTFIEEIEDAGYQVKVTSFRGPEEKAEDAAREFYEHLRATFARTHPELEPDYDHEGLAVFPADAGIQDDFGSPAGGFSEPPIDGKFLYTDGSTTYRVRVLRGNQIVSVIAV
jgi:hypothetical protein